MSFAAGASATVRLTGLVTDGSSGGILPNILVQITDGANAGASAHTDTTGTYTIAGLMPGSATVSLSAVSYVSTTKSVTLSSNARLDVVLQRVPTFVVFGTVTMPKRVAQYFSSGVNATDSPAHSKADSDGSGTATT